MSDIVIIGVALLLLYLAVTGNLACFVGCFKSAAGAAPTSTTPSVQLPPTISLGGAVA